MRTKDKVAGTKMAERQETKNTPNEYSTGKSIKEHAIVNIRLSIHENDNPGVVVHKGILKIERIITHNWKPSLLTKSYAAS